MRRCQAPFVYSYWITVVLVPCRTRIAQKVGSQNSSVNAFLGTTLVMAFKTTQIRPGGIFARQEKYSVC